MYIPKMFDRHITTLGNLNKKVLREFVGRKRMTAEQYASALIEYNKRVDEKKKQTKAMIELPAYMEQPVNNEKQFYKEHIVSTNVKSIEMGNTDNKTRATMSYLREELHKHIGKLVIVQYIIPEKTKKQLIKKIYTYFGNDIDNHNVIELINKLSQKGTLVHETKEIVGENFSSWWKLYAREWWIGSDVDILGFCEYKGKLLIYPENENIIPSKVFQYFKEGITNCLYTPIIKEAIKRQEEAKSDTTMYKYKKIVETCIKLQEEQLDSGVPEDYLNELANKLQIDIKIHFPFINKYINAKSIKKPIMSFHFTNTRLNHVELNQITYDNNFIEVNEEELEEIKKKYDWYVYGCNSIRTLDGNYRVESPLRKAINEFETECNLYQYKIDDVNDKDLSIFIRNGTHYNETIDFVDVSTLYTYENEGIVKEAKYNNVKVNHFDMQKAYANFWTCMFYKGFLGKITDFRETDKIVGLGFYYIYGLDFTEADEKFVRYNKKLRIYYEGVYPSVELDMLTHYGVKYQIKYGCWGVKNIDFRFTDEMLDNKYYAKCVGIWDSHNLQNMFSYIGCHEHYQVLRYENPDANLKYFETGEITLLVDKEHNYHLGHFTGFILAYQRMNVIEQLMEMDYDKLIRICVDGIYTCETNFKICNVFREKTDYNFNNEAGQFYISNYKKDFVCSGESREHYAKELNLGAGGCGKTHNNLVDKGLVRTLFVAPSWKLAIQKKNEYNANVSVWDRVYSTDPIKTNMVKRYYNTLIFDEVSMMSEGQKNKIFELYPECKIIFCGDIGHQLPCFEKGSVQMNTNGFDYIKTYTENRRCKCPELKVILDTLRLFNTQNRSIDFIKIWLKTKLLVIKKEEIEYNINDMILVATKEQVKYYSDKYTNKFSMEKYRINSNNRLYNNGEIVISKDKPDGCEAVIQHAFTCHSIQGETAKHKLFIDTNKIFEKTMLYTAISRAEYLHQIKLVV